MASLGQLALAAEDQRSRSAFSKAGLAESERRGKASLWGGRGRMLGLLGTTLATAGMSNPLTAAILVGMGGLATRSIFRAFADGREQDANKEIDALFYQRQQDEFKKDIKDYQKGMRERMITDTGRDIFSAYAMRKYMPEVQEFGKDLGEYGLKDTMARTFGIGGEQFGQRVTAEGVAHNPWLLEDDTWATTAASAAPVVDPTQAVSTTPAPIPGTTPAASVTTTPADPDATQLGPLDDEYWQDPAFNISGGMSTTLDAGRGMSNKAIESGVDPAYISEAVGTSGINKWLSSIYNYDKLYGTPQSTGSFWSPMYRDNQWNR